MTKPNTNKVQALIMNNYLLSASLIYILSSFLLKGINFITTPIYTRVMSVEEYGTVSTAVSVTSFIAIFICLQISGSINTAKVEYEGDSFKGYINHITIFAFIVAILWAVPLGLVGNQITSFMSLDNILIIPIIVSAIGTCFVNIYSMYVIALKRPKSKAIFSLIYSIMMVGVCLPAVILANFHKDYARLFGIALVNLCVICFVLIKIKEDTKHITRSMEDFKKDIKFGLGISIPLIPHLFANLINNQVDRVFIVRLLGQEQVGIYSAAYSLGMAGLAFTDAFIMAWNPWYFEKTKNGYNKEINLIAKSVLLLLSFLFSIVILLAPEVLSIIAPSSYSSAKYCVVAVAYGVFFQTLYRFPLGYETCKKNTKYTALCTIITAGVNIGLNAILIPLMGIFGAAIATTISYVVLFGLHDFIARKIIKYYNISIKSYVPSILIITFAVIVSCFAMDMLLARIIGLCILLPAILVMITRIRR